MLVVVGALDFWEQLIWKSMRVLPSLELRICLNDGRTTTDMQRMGAQERRPDDKGDIDGQEIIVDYS